MTQDALAEHLRAAGGLRLGYESRLTIAMDYATNNPTRLRDQMFDFEVLSKAMKACANDRLRSMERELSFRHLVLHHPQLSPAARTASPRRPALTPRPRRRTSVGQFLHDRLHQVVGCRCARGDQHGLDAFEPRVLQPALVVQQPGGRAVGLADLGESDRVGTVLTLPTTSVRSARLRHVAHGVLAVGCRVADVFLRRAPCSAGTSP